MAKLNTDSLTPTEFLVFHELVETSQSQPEIAVRLKMTTRTVKFHCGNIFRKTGRPDRLDLMLAHWRERSGITRTAARPKAGRRAA